ncbi:MAG: STAS domain-containing protein [Anaerolineales bacterium]|jgi:anti-anti-sigma factor|uniref:STAS domain-containing protein n=1 Tax=Candidatus Villigracilis vicinus TaxID=3140679 RepID=UPI0031360DD8|nr:STAS domain-containing protein [Anaerolineales bacterium]MBK9782263.1 STAS domain-containing protein [Anaerolineales bacterium]
MLNFTTRVQNARVPVTVLSISGDIDSSNFQVFQSCVDEQLAQGATHVLLNFSEVKRISSAGLRVIHNLFNKLRDIHKDVNDEELRKKMSSGAYKSPYIKISNLAPNLAEIFSLGGFDIYIEILDDEAKAVASF